MLPANKNCIELRMELAMDQWGREVVDNILYVEVFLKKVARVVVEEFSTEQMVVGACKNLCQGRI